MPDTIDSQAHWNQVFRQRDGSADRRPDPWLDRWLSVIGEPTGRLILDLGCGGGHDAAWLTRLGYAVVATDFAEEALAVARRIAPEADFRQVDLRQPLPFESESFDIVVANLSLHYFPWDETVRILTEVRRCLKPGGVLLSRWNARGGKVSEAEIEPGYGLVDGLPRRLVDDGDLRRLFAAGWSMISLSEQTVDTRYMKPKLLWEAIVRRA